MNNDLISVVVPCYNVEKYLEKCVKSIINQTYQNLEIILVDDGATDSTPQLCDELSKLDKRIKVIHKENGGVSDARNIGINVAKGKYITFIDSDDWIKPDTLEVTYREIISQELDLVIWGYSADFVDLNENLLHNRFCVLNGICEKISCNNTVLLEESALGLLGYTWNKLYKTEIIKSNHILFDTTVSLVEDLIFNSLYINCCEKIKFIDYIGTHYIQRNRITLGTKYYENIFELKLMGCDARENILKHFNVNPETISKIMGIFYFEALKSALKNILKKQNFKKTKKFLHEKTTQTLAKKSINLSIKYKIFILLIRLKATFLLTILKDLY